MTQYKSTLAWPNGKVYAFEKETGVPGTPGLNYFRYDFVSGATDQGAQAISPNWKGLRDNRPDAAVYWGFGKIYFFYGDEYVRYDMAKDAVDPEYLPPNLPLKIGGNWNMPWTDRIDGAVNWGNGKIYFFRGPEYLRYDITLDRMDDGYPKPIDGNWNNIWTDGIDAVLYQGGTKAYFFKGDEFRRYDLAADNVDQNGAIDTLVLDPVPAGLWTPGRALTLAQANQVMGYLIQTGVLTLSPTQTPYTGDWSAGITSPAPTAHVVIQPTTINGVQFINDLGAASLIDNVDQRMVIALCRLTRWVNSSEPTVTIIRHKGIGHGNGPANDCHNQGRALDFSGVDGTSQDANFDRKIMRDWGSRPVVSGVAMRLDPVVDKLAHDIFRTVVRFATFECECNGVGSANKWPPKEIGDTGGLVIHPDYIDAPGSDQLLRPQHQDHIHMQIGPTRT
ncbi:MAG: hypothetical protein HGA47_02245 [Zoogloea sp.]|nr:hypothetical protein [Zoogloea sp.]